MTQFMSLEKRESKSIMDAKVWKNFLQKKQIDHTECPWLKEG